MTTWIRSVLLGVLMVIALAACGSKPVTHTDIPLPPDITALAPGQNTLADTLNSSFSDALRSHGTVETKLYSVAATMTWAQVSAFYAEQLEKRTGSRPRN